MTWRSPRGHKFADPTLAMVDALLTSGRIRHTWARRADGLQFLCHITQADYRDNGAVREFVDDLLHDAGFTWTDAAPSDTKGR